MVVYILDHQPAFTLGKSYYTVKAQFASAAAVTSGQGQSVDVAGVQVGQVGAVDLEDGRAVVTMNIYKKYKPIYRNATVLLRPRTPLKDMYLSLDPGTADAGSVPDGGTLPVANTAPDVNVEEILASLDADTRNYLLLLLGGGAQLFHDGNASGAAPSTRAVADLTRHVQALRAAQPGHEAVHLAAGTADQEHPQLDPQPAGGLSGARRRRRNADLADQLVQPELRRDLLAGRRTSSRR